MRKLKRSEQTIRAYLAHLRKALKWDCSQGYLRNVPNIDMPVRAKAGGSAKGWHITTEEFERMLAAIPKVVLTKDSQPS